MIVRITFKSADNMEQWKYLKGTQKLEVSPKIKLSDLSEEIRVAFGIPEGRSHAFYMENDIRKMNNAYSDLVDETTAYKDSSKYTLAEALISDKFKYEYSFSDGLRFQCVVE